jgi:hypothetical protein
VPRNAQEEVKIAYWKLFDVPDKIAPGQKAVDYVQKRIDEFAARRLGRPPGWRAAGEPGHTVGVAGYGAADRDER